MLDLDEIKKTFQFKLKGETYSLKELTVGDLEKLEKKATVKNYTELNFYMDLMEIAGLERSIAKSLTMPQLKKLSEGLKDAK